MRQPNLLGLVPSMIAGLADYYEYTMADVNHEAGIAGRRSVFNAAVRGLRPHKLIGEHKVTSDGNTIVIDGEEVRLAEYNEALDGKEFTANEYEKDNYLLCTGLEQVLGFIMNWNMNDDLIQAFNKRGLGQKVIDALRGSKLHLTIDAIPEGYPVFGHEPFVSVEGTFEQCQFPESLILGTIGYQTAVATSTSYFQNIMEEFGREDIITLEGGSRRAYPGSALAATRAALIGGFKGTSLVEIVRQYPELLYKIGGSSGHSEVLHIGNDEEAFDLQARAYFNIKEDDSAATIRAKVKATGGAGPTFLIDTFDSNKGLEAAIRIMQRYNFVSEVRLDSGDKESGLVRIGNRFTQVALPGKIMNSDDYRAHIFYEVLRKGLPLNKLLAGTFVVNQPYLPGPVYKLAMDQVGDNPADMELRCKVCADNLDKGTLPGKLDVYRIIGRDGYARKDVVLMRDVDTIDTFMRRSDDGYIKLNKRVMEDGKLCYDIPDMNEIIEFADKQRRMIPEKYRRFKGAVEYPVEISKTITRAKAQIADKFAAGSM